FVFFQAVYGIRDGHVTGVQTCAFRSSLRGIVLRWRVVPETPQIAFFPETISSPDILAERNAELRRVMIERVGFEKFLREVKAKEIGRAASRERVWVSVGGERLDKKWG